MLHLVGSARWRLESTGMGMGGAEAVVASYGHVDELGPILAKSERELIAR